MSARTTVWAWEQDAPPTAKLVLLAYADSAAEATHAVQITQADIAAVTGLGERTVRENVARLKERLLLGAYARFEDGKRIADVMVLAVEGSIELPAVFAGGKQPAGFAGSDLQGDRGESDHRQNRPGSTTNTTDKDSVGKGSRGRRQLPVVGDSVPPAMVEDAAALLKRRTKVGTQLVTPEEMALAVEALATFNRVAEYDYGLAAHLKGIVGRVRERPSFDVAAHVRLVESAWRLRWWEKRGSKRRATPAVIYGNAGVFEQVIADATDEKAGRSTSGATEEPKRFVRKGPAREF